MKAQIPSMRFVRQHVSTLDYLPRHLTPRGDVSKQTYRSTCACGWTSPPEPTQLLVGSDHQDHVLQAWFARDGQD